MAQATADTGSSFGAATAGVTGVAAMRPGADAHRTEVVVARRTLHIRHVPANVTHPTDPGERGRAGPLHAHRIGDRAPHAGQGVADSRAAPPDVGGTARRPPSCPASTPP